MKISRERAKQLCTKSQYGEATWWETMQLKFYLLFNKEVAEFSAKNTKLTSLCEQANMQMISEDEKEDMKKKLKDLF